MSDKKKVNVLVVDDDPLVCDLLQEDLDSCGYQCGKAADGREALAKLAAQSFDLVLLDIRLPGTSGLDLLPLVRAQYPRIAVVMITAVNDIETAVAAVKLGASDYITKPFDMAKLDATVRRVLDENRHPAGTEMDAIALGVEANLNLSCNLSGTVVERTIEIARRLEISEESIREWAEARRLHEVEKHGSVRSALHKLEANPLAQQALQMMTPISCPPESICGN